MDVRKKDSTVNGARRAADTACQSQPPSLSYFLGYVTHKETTLCTKTTPEVRGAVSS